MMRLLVGALLVGFLVVVVFFGMRLFVDIVEAEEPMDEYWDEHRGRK